MFKRARSGGSTTFPGNLYIFRKIVCYETSTFKMCAEQKQVAEIPAGWADQRTASKLGWQVSRQGWLSGWRFNWFASLKHIFLLNRESVFDSVWTIVLFRINATKWNPVWIYFLIFKNSTLGIYTFNIFYIQLQHLNIKCWICLLELLN